ncbi:MAG: sigma-54 dependent transcriptional regulator, partial [Bdellovibrionota bacterium]
MSKVLIVDDEKNITLVIQAMLAREGVEGAVFNDSTRALHELDSSRGSLRYSAVITDLYMPGLGGMDLLEHCKKHFPQLPVIIITAFGTVEAAVAALKKGAFDFVTKPFDQTDLLNSVRKAILTSDQEKRGPGPTTIAWSAPDASPIIGRGAQMQEVFRVISKIAASPSSVLVWGESGTGKELIALDIHKNSDRAKKPFIKINCAAIPSTLIESELFGYEKGAFTGAVTSKPGRFELAHEGTLFLDEVAEMPLEMQVKLLRALQEHEFERVGGISTIRVDVRIIAATNKDLEAEVKSGKFR